MVFAMNAREDGGSNQHRSYEGEEIAEKNGPATNEAIPIRAIFPRLYKLLKAEESFVKAQTGEDWHFGDQASMNVSASLGSNQKTNGPM